MSALSFPQRRTLVLAIVGALAVAGAAFLRPALVRHQQLSSAVAATSPDDAVLADAVAQGQLTAGMLKQYWSTGRIPHRRAAMTALVSHRGDSPELNQLWKEWLPEASADPDYQLRELVLGSMGSLTDPPARAAISWQLTDSDPDLRQIGLNHLRRLGNLQYVPWVLPMLSDPSPAVAFTADATLRHWSGRDSGLRLSQIPRGTSLLTRPRLPEADAVAIRKAASDWTAWWAVTPHPDGLVTTHLPAPKSIRGVCPEFQLLDLQGKAVKPGDFRGKHVLINFWATWCSACLVEIPLLVELQRRHPADLVILGVSLDSPRDATATTEGEGTPATPKPGDLRKRVATIAARQHINYPVLLDPENSVGQAFLGGELPTNVLLDPKGRVRRRFIGEKSLDVWEAFLKESLD
jgi:thiol-disulfide isomerase/thioredoxin